MRHVMRDWALPSAARKKLEPTSSAAGGCAVDGAQDLRRASWRRGASRRRRARAHLKSQVTIADLLTKAMRRCVFARVTRTYPPAWPRGAELALGAKNASERNRAASDATMCRPFRLPHMLIRALRGAPSPSPVRLRGRHLDMGSSAVEWNRDMLTRLLHALALSRGSLTHAAELLPDLSTGAIRTALRQVSLAHRNPSSWSDAKHTTFVLQRVLNHSMPPATPPPAAPHSSTVPKRVVLQLVPATKRDAAIVRAAKHHPFLELKLRPRRPLWDVYAHVYSKWGLPIRLLTLNHLSIHTSVAAILPQGSALVRLQYQVINLPVDFSALSCILPSDHQPHSPTRQLLTTDTDDQFWTENTASHLPVLDFGADSLFNIASTHIDSHPPPPEPCPPLMKNRRVVAPPLSLHPHLHPHKKKPSRARARPTPPRKKSIAKFPSARSTIKKVQSSGEKAVLNLLRSHLEQLSPKSSEPAATPKACMPVPDSTDGADTNNINFSHLGASDSMFAMGLSTPLQQPAISNGANESGHDSAAHVPLAHEALSLMVRDEIAVDLNHTTHFDAQRSTIMEPERATLLPAPDASLNFSALFQDL